MYSWISGKLEFETEETAERCGKKLLQTDDTIYFYMSEKLAIYPKKILFIGSHLDISATTYENTISLLDEITLEAWRGKITIECGDSQQKLCDRYYISPALLRKQNEKARKG